MITDRCHRSNKLSSQWLWVEGGFKMGECFGGKMVRGVKSQVAPGF